MMSKNHSGLRWLALAALPLLAPAVQAQNWEVGVGGGASFYTKQTIASTAGSVEASFQPGFGFTAYAGQTGRRYGGEIRFDYFMNDMQLAGMGKSFRFGGSSQAIYYDIMVLAGSKEARVRPYLSVGGGVKFYQGTGQDMAVQPLGNIAVLTRTSQWKPLITAGGGIRFQLSQRTVLRAEVKTFITQNPGDVITSITGQGGDGWIYNFAPVFSVAFIF